MKTATLMLGMAAGMAMAAAGLIAMYPDVSRRMVRDSKRALKCGKRAMGRFEHMFS